MTFNRIYKTTGPGGETWATSYSYGYRDLPLIEKCASAAFEWIAAQYANADVPF